ncbi:MAG TPA: galactokinase [Candidatus Sulfotelmatobacter sp.]|jgi:galactokinase
MNLSEFIPQFERVYAARPRVFRAPGRVNLIGEHTDYNDGFVMPAAVGFSTYAGIAPRTDRKLVLQSQEFPGCFEFDLDNLPQQRNQAWVDYVVGVATVLRRRGIRLEGANLLVNGNIPIGAGLSSSAALEVVSTLAFLSLTGTQMPLPEVATLCREAENTYVGAHVGIMDQYISCMGKAGHAMLLDCRSLEFRLVPIPPGLQLVVCNTMVKHDVATSGYNVRRAQCEEGVGYFVKWYPNIRALRDVSVEMLHEHSKDLSPVILKRCTHVILENQRTVEAARSLTDRDLARMKELMAESHASMRDLYEISCQEVDIMVDSAQDLPGFCGGRMTGGGFGGCTINLVRTGNASDFAAQIADRYQRATNIKPQIYICSAEDGAQALN